MAAAYRTRPPYPPAVFPLLEGLQPRGPGRVLDLGCGTGDLTIPLAQRAASVDGVDPSEPMIRAARRRPGGASNRIRWHVSSAEDFEYADPYDLICGGDSLHWMDVERVIPKVARALAPEGYLAVASRSRQMPDELGAFLGTLIPRYSTNREYQPYDTVEILSGLDLFEEVDRRSFVTDFAQTVDELVECLHSQNGFSRDRMPPAVAAEFDARLREAASDHAVDGRIPLTIVGTVVWGHALG